MKQLRVIREFLAARTSTISTSIAVTIISGVALRVLLSAISYGPQSLSSWLKYAYQIQLDGLAEVYSSDTTFSHPPLAGFLAAKLLVTADRLSLPFALMFRAPSICADALILVLLFIVSARYSPAQKGRVLSYFSLALVSILVSGFAGGFSSLAALAILGATYLTDTRSNPLMAGLLTALAVNFNLGAIAFLPLMFLHHGVLESKIRYSSGFLLGLFPILLTLVYVGGDYLRNILLFPLPHEAWGMLLPFGLLSYFEVGQSIRDTLAAWFATFSPLLILGVAWLSANSDCRSGRSIYPSAALIGTLSPLLSVSFDPSDFVILLPLLLVAAPRWGCLTGSLAGLCLVTLYVPKILTWIPLRTGELEPVTPLAVMLQIFLWSSLVGYVGLSFLERFYLTKDVSVRKQAAST